MIGGGQSGAEVVDYLLTMDDSIKNLIWVSKRINFHSLDDSCFANEFHSPTYLEYFYKLPNNADKFQLLKQQPMQELIVKLTNTPSVLAQLLTQHTESEPSIPSQQDASL